jgi:hypothetical protein
MALATRPKPKTHQKKRQAQHHRQSKIYLKPYWPYLPMFAVVGIGILANNHWPSSLVSLNSGGAQTRIEAMVGNQNTWALIFIIVMAGGAFAIFTFQHWFRVQRALNRGERFVVKHPWFDIVLVAVATAGVLLTRTNLGY